MRYSAYSQAAYMSTSGGPVGDPRWEPHYDGSDEEDSVYFEKPLC